MGAKDYRAEQKQGSRLLGLGLDPLVVIMKAARIMKYSSYSCKDRMKAPPLAEALACTCTAMMKAFLASGMTLKLDGRVQYRKEGRPERWWTKVLTSAHDLNLELLYLNTDSDVLLQDLMLPPADIPVEACKRSSGSTTTINNNAPFSLHRFGHHSTSPLHTAACNTAVPAAAAAASQLFPGVSTLTLRFSLACSEAAWQQQLIISLLTRMPNLISLDLSYSLLGSSDTSASQLNSYCNSTSSSQSRSCNSAITADRSSSPDTCDGCHDRSTHDGTSILGSSMPAMNLAHGSRLSKHSNYIKVHNANNNMTACSSGGPPPVDTSGGPPVDTSGGPPVDTPLINQLPRLPLLQHLDLQGCNLGHSELYITSLCSWLEMLPALRVLSLGNNQLGASGLADVLSSVSHLEKLEYLGLSHNGLYGQHQARLIASGIQELKELRCLDLRNNEFHGTVVMGILAESLRGLRS
ncbi:hypothetical protein CEUSTIGMA_g7892.t1 [Chlamydomonas eustigma]|uniref:Uncharacterized protein n=1 Tax=Chlamydomonas eustigma TaxID=1157962 RepID=A0A250XBI6_9CHLO|nr:hypothetical protein CEUSTIGMA_g7892.t1 [Chlamydomonas eustigma]|eukprot:GAX80453.1 hypothetical protein CEUSTIGMA_g7892.t1 [Chlamydomonas eustigma]